MAYISIANLKIKNDKNVRRPLYQGMYLFLIKTLLSFINTLFHFIAMSRQVFTSNIAA